MIYHDLIIVGGGASGLMSAVIAKDYGIDVAIVEGSDRVGKKILATGNGRCNVSNASVKYPFKAYHSSNDGFFIDTLSKFGTEETRSLFLSLGLPFIELHNSRLYPQSLQASSVVDLLRLALEDKGVPIYTECKVKSIQKKKKDFLLLTSNDEYTNFSSEKLLLCTGGKSAVKTGSDGSMYNICKEFGHKIIKPLPGIVQLKLDYPYLKAMSGVKFDGVVKLSTKDKVIREEFGEILFTDYGISGPPIFLLSSTASRYANEDIDIFISVDIMHDKTFEEVESFIYSHLAMFSHRGISDSLIGVVNKKLIPSLLKEAKIFNIHKPCYELDWQEQANLIKVFKDWTFKCTGPRDLSFAQVTVGGIDTTDVNPKTLESNLVENLYFAGEILDVDGDCGGFNLQWAWSSAYNAVTSLKSK